jgi:hypothetical protein
MRSQRESATWESSISTGKPHRTDFMRRQRNFGLAVIQERKCMVKHND